MTRKIQLVDPVEFQCPFCGNQVQYGDVSGSQYDTAIMHDAPICRKYDELEAADYILEALREVKKSAPN